MRLTKTGLAHNGGQHQLADVDLENASFIVNQPSQRVQICFTGKDGNSNYSYSLSLSLEECLSIHSRVFRELMGTGVEKSKE